MGDEKKMDSKKMPIRRFTDSEDDADQTGKEEFAEMFQESLRQAQVGDVVKGVVVKIGADYVLVSVEGIKSEGRISLDEFKDPNGELSVKEGDEVRVLFERKEDRSGCPVLSRAKAEQQGAWEKISEAGGEGGVIEGQITGKVKGGLIVDIGVAAFLPASQIDIRPVGNLDKLIGQTFKFRIVKVNRKRGNVVLSRRAMLEEERDKLKEQTLTTLAEGEILDGIVKNITDYGAFVDLGGIDGLLHVTDMSWGRLAHPSELIKVGDKIRVMVLKYDREKGRISLGMKQTKADPWQEVKNKYTIGERLSGKVVSLADYGAFVALEEGIEGLVHVSEMSWTRKVKHPSELLKVGDQLEAVVLNIDSANRRISLGLKQVQVNPWTVIGEKYPVGTKIEGQIKNITDFGIFIGVDEGIDGLVHVSDISWTKRVKHPAELFTKGQTVQAVVLNIDAENERLSLGIKQLSPDPWSEIPVRYKTGSKVKGKVSSLTDFGIFIEIEDGIEGLIHVSELSREKVESAKDFAAVGDELEAVVLSVDKNERKIALSVKALQIASEKAEIASYMGEQGSATSNLGELLKVGLKKNGKNDK
jgi:small subunit ribosomal protein S1